MHHRLPGPSGDAGTHPDVEGRVLSQRCQVDAEARDHTKARSTRRPRN